MTKTETLNIRKTFQGAIEISGIGGNRMQYMGYSKKDAINRYLIGCKPIAAYATSAWGGIVVLDFDYGIEDYCLCGINNGVGNGDLRWRKIYTSENGKNFIKYRGQRYNLSDFIRA